MNAGDVNASDDFVGFVLAPLLVMFVILATLFGLLTQATLRTPRPGILTALVVTVVSLLGLPSEFDRW